MELTGEQLIAQPRDKVWAALNDTEILRGCITGCESIEMVAEHEYKVGLFAAVGPLKARFTGKMTMQDVMPPDSYALNFEGAGGVAGFAKGNAAIRLVPEGESTRLSYVVKVTVGGKLAQIGSRLIDGVAKKMSDEFFAAFEAKLGGKEGAGSVATSAAAVDPAVAAAGDALPPAAATAGVAQSPKPDPSASNKAPLLPWILFAASVVIGVVAYWTK